jgi:hypothetical protein
MNSLVTMPLTPEVPNNPINLCPLEECSFDYIEFYAVGEVKSS